MVHSSRCRQNSIAHEEHSSLASQSYPGTSSQLVEAANGPDALPRTARTCAGDAGAEVALTISSPLPSPTDHIHPVISIFIDGHEVVIPPGVGLTSTTNFNPHTHDFSGTIHVGEGGPAGTGSTVRNVTLQDFFDVWRTVDGQQSGKNANAIFDTDPNDGTPLPRIMDKTVDATHVLRMYVKESSDAAPELEYDSSAASNNLTRPELYVGDGDQIIISYDKIAQPAFGPSFDTIANQTVLVGALFLARAGWLRSQRRTDHLRRASRQSKSARSHGAAGEPQHRHGRGRLRQNDLRAVRRPRPRVTNRIVQLINSGFYNKSASNQITFHRVVANSSSRPAIPRERAAADRSSAISTISSIPICSTPRPASCRWPNRRTTPTIRSFSLPIRPHRFLDFNHSIFGRLTEGEAIRDAINSVPTTSDHPNTPVVINSISLVQNNTENAVLKLKAKAGATGTTTVTVTAHDAQNHSFSQTFQVTFAADTSNGAPYLQDVEPVGISGQPIPLRLSSIDVEGDPVVYHAIKPTGETANYTLDVNSNTGLVTITPPAGFVGTFNVLARVKSVTANSTGTGQDFDEQIVPVTVAAAGPGAVDLVSGSDTGSSSSDNITNASSLDFLVTGVTSGATVKLLKGTTVLAQGTASGTSITLTVANPGTQLGQGASGITPHRSSAARRALPRQS